MTARIAFTARAYADLGVIQLYLAEPARSYVATKDDHDFETLFDRLRDHPLSGAPRSALGRNIRIGVVSPYIVIYRYSGGIVLVLRVIDRRRRIIALFYVNSAPSRTILIEPAPSPNSFFIQIPVT